jgi:hypothetical protein
MLVGVYFIPWLIANIVSLRQLEEDGHQILLFSGYLKVWDQHGILVAKVACITNWLYTLKLNVGRPVCLATQGSSAAWRRHTRFGHLNFLELRHLADGDMVDGLPQIDHVNQV